MVSMLEQRAKRRSRQMLRKSSAFIAGLLVLTAGRAARADLLIQEWSLGVGVYDESSEEYDVHIFSTVENPFENSHIARVGISSSWASYNFGWSDSGNTGSFRTDSSQAAEDVDSVLLDSFGSGRIYLQPTDDLSLSVEARYTYYLPPDMMFVRLVIAVAAPDDDDMLFHSGQQDDSFDGYPASGTFAVDAQMTLPAGHRYALDYHMWIYSFAGGTHLLGTGSGYVSFEVEPVPEPASACLLSLGALMLLRRRRRQTRHRTASRKGLQCDPTAPRF